MGVTLLVKQLLSAESVNGTSYSSAMKFDQCRGFTAIRLLTTGSTTITQQCSLDGTTFYDPIDEDATAIGLVITTRTSDAYIQFSPVIAPYIRFKFVTVAAQTVSATLISLEQ